MLEELIEFTSNKIRIQ